MLLSVDGLVIKAENDWHDVRRLQVECVAIAIFSSLSFFLHAARYVPVASLGGGRADHPT